MVKTGIFWLIHGNIYFKSQEKNEQNEILKESVKLTQKIDSDFGHFTEWDELCGNRFPYADFATFPRGRVLYDVIKNESIIYYDECITEEQITEIARLFDLKKYRAELDEHYACDKCVKRKKIFL